MYPRRDYYDVNRNIEELTGIIEFNGWHHMLQNLVTIAENVYGDDELSEGLSELLDAARRRDDAITEEAVRSQESARKPRTEKRKPRRK